MANNNTLSDLLEIASNAEPSRAVMQELVMLSFDAGKKKSKPDALIVAANAVIERWDSPLWKDIPATAIYINALRDAVAEATK